MTLLKMVLRWVRSVEGARGLAEAWMSLLQQGPRTYSGTYPGVCEKYCEVAEVLAAALCLQHVSRPLNAQWMSPWEPIPHLTLVAVMKKFQRHDVPRLMKISQDGFVPGMERKVRPR